MPGFFQKVLFVPPVVLGAAGLVYVVALKKPPAQSPPEEQARLVRVITAQAMPVVPRVVGYGAVAPGRVWDAVAQVAGKVEYVAPAFKKGAILKKGLRIVGISKLDYKLAIREARANIRSADARLAELKVSEQNTRASLGIEKSALAIRKREFDRKSKLAKRGVVSGATLDAEKRNLLSQSKIIQELENTLRLIPAQVAAQEETKAVYEAKLETARLNLARTDITLPFDARVALKSVEITQFVNVGQKLGSFDGMKTAEIEAQIAQVNLRRFIKAVVSGNPSSSAPQGITEKTIPMLIKKAGVHAVVRPRFVDRKTSWRGRLARISDTIDPKTRTVGVIVAVDDVYALAEPGKQPPLIKGMFVEVELRANAVGNLPVVPRSVLQNGSIYVANAENRLEIRDIRIDFVQGDIAVIAEGLKPGDRVVVGDLSPAIEGQLLKPVEDKRLSARISRDANGNEAGK